MWSPSGVQQFSHLKGMYPWMRFFMELNKDGQKDSVVQVKERNIQTRATLAQKGEDAQPKCSVT